MDQNAENRNRIYQNGGSVIVNQNADIMLQEKDEVGLPDNSEIVRISCSVERVVLCDTAIVFFPVSSSLLEMLMLVIVN
jgi:hypothetical protein